MNSQLSKKPSDNDHMEVAIHLLRALSLAEMEKAPHVTSTNGVIDFAESLKSMFPRPQTKFDLFGQILYALTYVCIEVWIHYGLYDDEVDGLLKEEENIALFRNFRNAILHANNFTDKRVVAMSKITPTAIAWQTQLILGMRRYLIEYFETNNVVDREWLSTCR